MKVALATCKMYVSLLPEPELALACVVVCGGAVLFLLGWRLDQFFEPELEGAPELPLKLRANSVQARPQVSANAQSPTNFHLTIEIEATTFGCTFLYEFPPTQYSECAA